MPKLKGDWKNGHPLFYKIAEEICTLHDKKNYQYASVTDPLGNFRRTGQIINKMLKPGIDPTMASCLSFMSKQVDGIYEIFGEDKQGTFDSLEDKLLDVCVYSIIGIIVARQNNSMAKPPKKRRRKVSQVVPIGDVPTPTGTGL